MYLKRTINEGKAAITGGVIFTVAGSIFFGIYLTCWFRQGLLFHSAIESLGGFIAWLMAIVLMRLVKQNKVSSIHIWTSSSLAGMGTLDLLHSFVYPGVTFVWLHSTATVLGGIVFALTWLPQRMTNSSKSIYIPVFIAFAAFVFGTFSILFPQFLPGMLIGGRFTFVARALNVSGGILFLAAALSLYLKYRKSGESEYFVFTNHCILFGLAGLLFEQSQLWSAGWWWWHFLRLSAYMVALSYLFIAYKQFESSIRKANEELKEEIAERKMIEAELESVNNSLERRVSERTAELVRKNRQLHSEIEERMAAQEKVSIFTSLINHSGDAIFVVDPETSRFLDFNEQAVKSSGYRREELQNLGVVDIDTEISDMASFKQHVRALKANRWQFFQGNLKAGDGKEFPVEVSCKYITCEGSDYIISIARDVTERRQMEEVLLQAEKLKSLGVMTSGIAHEFNNILAIIKGFTVLIKEKYGDHKELSNKLRIILKSVTDGMGIVNRMQEFTRMEEDEIRFEPLDIGEIIEQAVQFTMPRWNSAAQAKAITYHLDRKGVEKVPRVMGDSIKLRKVIINIVNNSLDAMPEGGNISFRTRKNNGDMFLDITDTGKGMSKEVRKHIFDPFFTTKMPKGTGLGMSVSYGIIKRHGGSIAVESEAGKGTTITIRLPVSRETRHLVFERKT